MNISKRPLCHGYTNQILAIDLGSGTLSRADGPASFVIFSLAAEGLGLYLPPQKNHAHNRPGDAENPAGSFHRDRWADSCKFREHQANDGYFMSPLTHIPGVVAFLGGFRPLYL